MHRLGFKRNSPRGTATTGDKAAQDDEVRDPSGETLSVAPRLIGQCGVPSNATVVVYDFYQRLLAIGTSDGRLKIVGADGVEVLFISPRGTEAKQVGLTAQGGVLRLSGSGCLELWSLPEEIILSFVDEENIECFELMHTTPFVVIGTRDGSIRIAQVVLGAGDDPQDLKMLPYRINRDALAGSGSIVALALQPGASTNKVLVGFSEGDVSLWSLFEKKLVMTGSSELNVNGAGLNDLRWLDRRGETFVTAYDDGSLWLWELPQEALPKYAPPTKPVNSTPLCRIDYNSGTGGALASVLSLACGQCGAEGRNHIVCHGISKEDMKCVLTMELEESRVAAARPSGAPIEAQACGTLPWFGNVESFCTIQSISSNLELEISAVVALAEFSTIHIYDIEQHMPFQVDTPMQRCTGIECLCLLRAEGSGRSNMYKRLSENPEEVYHPSVLASGAQWPITGGRAIDWRQSMAERPMEWGLMVSGHQDGVARVWDTGVNSLKLLGSVPSKDAPSSAITCVSVSSNLFALGYHGGEVRVYVAAQTEEKFAYEELVIGDTLQVANSTHDGSPFACLMRITTHKYGITSIQASVDLSLIVAGDKNGTISVIGLEGNMVFCGQVVASPIASVLLTVRDVQGGGGGGAETRRCVVASTEACSVTLVDLDDPKTTEAEVMTPKNVATFLRAAILDQVSCLVEASASASELVLPGLTRRKKGWTEQDSNQGDESLDDSSSESEGKDIPEPDNQDSGPDAMARGHHILQCSSGYLRIYPLTGIAKGERSTFRKVKTEVPFKTAAAVTATNGGPSSAVTIDEEGNLGVWGIPSFERYWSRGIGDVLGWKWRLEDKTRVGFSGDGQVVILSQEEMVRMSLLEDERRNPLPSLCLHDKEVADALEAALAAIAMTAKSEEETTPKAKQSKFGSFLSGSFSMISGQPVLRPAASISSQNLLSTFVERPPAPALAAAPAVSAGRTHSKSDSAATAAGASGARKSRWSPHSAGSSSSSAKAKPPGRRTVDEIKAAYGREATRTKNVMAENMKKLAERGEKLNQISDKTAELENDAADFMTMAKKLAEREKNKKWYEF